jgi:hypothetical protein
LNVSYPNLRLGEGRGQDKDRQRKKLPHDHSPLGKPADTLAETAAFGRDAGKNQDGFVQWLALGLLP